MLHSRLPDLVANLMAFADSHPVGLGRIFAREQAVQVADTLRDTAASYHTRRVLIDDASSSMRYDIYAVAFTWCLAAARDDPKRFSLVDLLDHYQHLIGKMLNFPDVSREQYESLFADVVQEYLRHGLSLRTVYLQRRSAAIDFGDRQMALTADCEWRVHRRDELSASEEFEMGWQLKHACFLEDDRAAVRVADEYFSRPLRNHRFDAWVSGLAMLPLQRLGRDSEASARYRTAAAANPAPGYLWSRGYHVEYLAIIGDFAGGSREFEAQLPAALAQPDPLSRYYCLRPATLLFERMAAEGVRRVAFKAPPGVPIEDRCGVVEVSQLSQWVWAEAVSIATRFDKRNGNSYYSEWLRRTIEYAGHRSP